MQESQDCDISTHQKTEILPSDIVEIMYTSGTTGNPKGVILTHENIAVNVNAVDELFPDYQNNHTFLSILPLSHIFEQTAGLLMPLFMHAHIIFAHKPTAITELIKKFGVTTMIAVPEFLQVVMGKLKLGLEKKNLIWLLDLLLKAQKKGASKKVLRFLSWPIRKSIGISLETVASGGAPLEVDTELVWSALGIDVLQGYGLTETAPVVSTNTFLEKKVGSVGKPLKHVEIKLENNEILVKGKNVFQGYYKNPTATKEAFINEWFKTGDLGEIDEDGFLFIKGRKKYMILGPGGQNVYPEDIETVLKQQPGVKDAAVVGIEKNNNSIIYAFVVGEKDLNLSEAIKNSNSQLASYQQIMQYSLWPEEDFPRTATRKIKKNDLISYVQHKDSGNSKTIINNKIIKIIASVCHCPIQDINLEDTIESLHLDSLKKAELTARIVEEYGVSFNEQQLTNQLKIKDLENIIKSTPATKPIKIKKWMQWPIIKIVRFILLETLCLAARLIVRVKIKNKNNLKITEPSLLMPNHISYMDPLLIFMSLPRRVRNKVACAAAQDALFEEFWWLSSIAEFLFYAFPISRGTDSNIDEAFSKMGQLLDAGYSILFFPEGKISKNENELLPLKQGAGLAAIILQTPVIPINISGAQKIQPYDKLIPRSRGSVEVNVGEAIKFKRDEDVATATEKISVELKKLK